MKASVEIGTGTEIVPTQSIETYQAVRPQNLIACMSKVAHYIAKSNPQVCEWDLNAGKDGCVQLDVVFPKDGGAPTAFDMAVHMAAVSLYEAGNRVITIAMICRTLCMSTRQKCFSENLQALVKASVYKLMRIRIRINAQSQKQQYQLERTKYDDYMLNLCETVARADNGVVSECFRFNCAPVVYSYSKAIKQYWSIPVQDVEASGRITNTISVITVRYALLRRILNCAEDDIVQKRYFLTNGEGKQELSDKPGLLGGHQRYKIYGRMDCSSANRHIANGRYIRGRVFFADEETAIAAGYRPCAICMRSEYIKWKNNHNG